MTPAEMQRALESRITLRHAADQPDLQEPLSESELRAGDGYRPAITSTDMTPRPRYRESQAAFQARMAAMGVELQGQHAEARRRNRAAALRTAEHGRYFTQCACGWCGLQVTDPEVARREYDAHACAAEGVGQAAVDRAIAETDRSVLVKRTRAVLQPSVVTAAPVEEFKPVVADDTEVRMMLLELK